jgi:hypothetical protein
MFGWLWCVWMEVGALKIMYGAQKTVYSIMNFCLFARPSFRKDKKMKDAILSID